MKKKFVLIVIFSFLLFTALVSQTDQEVIKEEVSVVNVEVPVRVYYKGKLVDNLKKEDFRLYDDKKLQNINAFYMRRKRMDIQNIKVVSERQKASLPPRYFVLVFRVTDYNDYLKDGVDFLFDKVLRDQDQILVFANDRTISLNSSTWEIDRKQILNQLLREESIKAKQRLDAIFLDIQHRLRYLRSRLTQDTGVYAPAITNFLDRYLITWNEYKKKYLIPDIDNFYNFSKHLEKIRGEKWVINFYQLEMFPKMKQWGEMRQKIDELVNGWMAGRSEDSVHSKIILELLENLDLELNVSDDFPSEEISRLFYKVDATFHTIFIRGIRESYSKDLEFVRVSSEIENSFRDLTKKTGGKLVATNDLGSALHTLSEKEDVYYMLTYAPENIKKIGKVRVAVNNKDYKVVYDKNIRADYITDYLARKKKENPTIEIAGIKLEDKILHVTLFNFVLKKNKKQKEGRLKLRVRIKDMQNKILYDQNRAFRVKKDVVNITINFDWLKKGKYDFILTAEDLFTGNSSVEFYQSETK